MIETNFSRSLRRRSINPPPMNHVKPRNGPISPRERDMNNSGYSNHQPSHYNNYNNSTQNNISTSSSPNSQQPQPQQPNSDLINFVAGAWKEKVSDVLTGSASELLIIRFVLDVGRSFQVRNDGET